MRQLLAEWSVTTTDNNNTDPCLQAAEQGIRCQSLQSSWVQIKNLNLPAVLEFVLPGGEKRFALVKKVQGDQVEVTLAEQSAKFPANEMLPLWTGNSMVAWKPGPAETKNLMPGDRSPLVAWVRQQLGMLATGEGETYYDEPLRGGVMEFQKSRGLKADGIIGTLTFLSLQTAGQSVGIPRLTPVAP
jgi:general secretion pathway protein A